MGQPELLKEVENKKSKYQVDLLLHAKMGNQSSDPSFQFEEAKPDGQN